MKNEDFHITLSVGGKSWKKIWHASKPMPVDHPPRWMLIRDAEGVFLSENPVNPSSDQKPHRLAIPQEVLKQGGQIQIPAPLTANKKHALVVKIKQLEPIRPAYLPLRKSAAKYDQLRPGQLFIFNGSRYFLIGNRPLGKKFKGKLEKQTIFNLQLTEGGYHLQANVPGLRLKFPDGAKQEVPVGTPLLLNQDQVTTVRIQLGKNWWRVNRVPTPDPLPLEEMETRERQESARFKQLSRFMVGFFILAVLAIRVMPIRHPEPEKPKEVVHLELKKAKIIPPIEQPKPKPPEPPKVEKKPEPKKPEPPKKKPEPPKKKPEPPKKKPEPPKPLPPKPQPPKPQVQPKPQPPKPVVMPPKAAVVPHPAPVAPPPKVVQPPVAVKPNPAAEAAKAKAQLAKSLSFLSPSLNKPVVNIQNEKVNSKYNTVGNVTDPKKANASVLSNIATSKNVDGPIETTNARNIASDVKLAGRGKALNEVQGKVSLNALYDPSSAGDMAASLGGKGLSMSGPGKISDAAIEKALSKHLQKFQYCYERALLADSSLAGNILMQWTIQVGGSANEIKVIRSQMNNSALHQCISQELARVQFPSPQGGPVIIKYPFSFTASTL